jgi:hypothetical protein
MSRHLLAKTLLFACFFVELLFTKLYGYIDVPIILLVAFGVYELLTEGGDIPRALLPLLGAMVFFAAYAMLISLIYGGVELIWVAKCGRTAMLILLLYYFYKRLRGYVSYELFEKFFVGAILIHSFIIYSAMWSPEFRAALDTFIGRVPRGPAWSLSTGLTVSSNVPSILHTSALLVLAMNSRWRSWKRLLLALAIAPSLFFLGKTMAYAGVVILLGYLVKKYPLRMVALVGALAIALTILPVFERLQGLEEERTISGQVWINVYSRLLPLLDITGEAGVITYARETLAPHIYFSDQWYVLLFGDSRSGHIGLAPLSQGETESDLGVINSINANGIPITLAFYGWYVYVIYLARRRCRPVAWIAVFNAVLCMIFSFKESGFFVGHSTPLMLFSLYYGLFPLESAAEKGRGIA